MDFWERDFIPLFESRWTSSSQPRMWILHVLFSVHHAPVEGTGVGQAGFLATPMHWGQIFGGCFLELKACISKWSYSCFFSSCHVNVASSVSSSFLLQNRFWETYPHNGRGGSSECQGTTWLLSLSAIFLMSSHPTAHTVLFPKVLFILWERGWNLEGGTKGITDALLGFFKKNLLQAHLTIPILDHRIWKMQCGGSLQTFLLR